MKHEAIVPEFEDKLKEYTRTAACGRRFVHVEKLLYWLRSSVEPPVEPPASHADRLLHVAYSERTLSFLPIAIEKFHPGDDCCLLVFCILHMIGCENKIDVFVRKKKVDRLLPLRWDSVQDTFRAAGVKNQDLPSRFYELQYLFCPAKFEMHGDDDWVEEVVIPICIKNSIKKGGTAELWQISVPEEFVGPSLRNIASGSRFDNNGSGKEPDWHYQFALKTFHGANYADYLNEVDAFRGLKDHEGMVRWLANYEKAKASGRSQENGATGQPRHKADNTTYNILLEYGEMDLGVYFADMPPPALPSDIEAFWRPLFAIADAVKGIHNLKTNDTGIAEEYYGWHADIKPDNILFVERATVNTTVDGNENSEPIKREKTFKLADPGFAKFVEKTKKDSEGVPKQRLRGGTETYGAPEYPGRSDNPVSQAIDIWSLGCVFSLAATWIALGYMGVNQFNRIRQLALRKQVQARLGQDKLQNQAVEGSQGDHFHNGHRVLEDVTNWHIYLRTVLRKTDTITSQVLDLVDKNMLLESAEQRINASRLCSTLDSILKSSSQTSEPQLPDTIKGVLGEAADVASLYQNSVIRYSQATYGKGALSYAATVRGARKSIYERSLKSSHLRASGPEQTSRGYDVNHLENEDVSSDPVAGPPFMSPSISPPPRKATTHDRTSSDSTIQTILSHRSRRGILKRHIPMNVFQAREAIERRKGGGLRLFSRNKHEETKDNLLLTSYFRGTRDIIFLVDNAESMEANWYEATYLLETLVEMAEGLDEDGMDLRFTTGTVKLEGKDSATKFVNSMKKARPRKGTRTDLRSSLGDVLDVYKNKLRERIMHPSITIKDVVLLILTDGIWAGLDDKHLVAEKLKDFQKGLKDIDDSLKLRPFSVEFIQFGHDEDATKRLIYLDDYLHKEGVPDIIDTEHSTGDVNKMLLGSFVEEYDNDEGAEMDPLGSPSSYHQFSDREMSPTSIHSEPSLPLGNATNAVQNLMTGQNHHRDGSGSSSYFRR